MTTAASLAQLLGTQSDINFYTMQLVYYTNLYDANQEKLSKQVKLEEKWLNEYDKAGDDSRSSALKMRGQVFLDKEQAGTEAQCKAWADYKVAKYDEDLKLELEALDMRYDNMKTLYDTALQTLKAQESSEQELVKSNAAKTYTLNGGG